MADGSCSSRSCVVKKKLYKRELQKWAKNVLYLVGLERVAREVIGHRKWKRLCVPFGVITDTVDNKAAKEVVDWTVNEKCIFCFKRQDASDVGSADDASNDEGSDRASSPLSIASDEPLDLSMGSRKARQNNNNNINMNHNSGDMNGTFAGLFLKVPRIPEKSGRPPKRRCGSDVDTSPTTPSVAHVSPSPAAANTDGSVAATSAYASASASVNAAALAKRMYTDDELQLALRDIHDGKLGTRRASILYGIPRSTLRNKVFKMTMDNRPDESPPSSDRTDDSRKPSPVPQIQQQQRSLMADDDVVTETRSHDRLSASESLKRLLRNRMTERLENKKAAAAVAVAVASASASSTSTATANDGRLKLPLLPDLIRKLSKERFEQECHRSREESGAVDNFILKIPSYKPAKSVSTNNDGTAASSQSSSGKGRAIRHVNRSEQNNRRRRRSRDKAIGASLRDIMAKSIAHRAACASASASASSVAAAQFPSKLKKEGERFPPFEANAKKKLLDDPSTSSATTTRTGSAVGHNEVTAAASLTSRKSCGKRMRAKRGRYRNYDRDNLMEAVRAVRRGEMSVHRAGSFYGVPHSTLEYKVKERHLMRPKKRRSSVAVSSGKTSTDDRRRRSSPPSSSKSSFVDSSGTYSAGDDDDDIEENEDGDGDGSTYDERSNSRESMLLSKSAAEVAVSRGRRCCPSVSSGATASASAAAAATSATATDASSAPLWPFALDFSNLNSSNFFASQMMRKLQEDAMTHAAAAAAAKRSSTSPVPMPPLTTTTMTSNGVDSSRDALLLSVLIRNGLQIQNPDAASSARK